MTSANVDTVIAAVVANPGTSAGISPDAIRAIWKATCTHVKTMLERRRSVLIPGFAHFVVQKHIGHSGTWGARVTWVPVVALLPTFCQSYGLPPNTQTSVLHQGATSPLTVNTAAVAAICSAAVSRHGVANTLKDMVREIGALASSATGRPLTIDFGFCSVQFHGRRLSGVRFDTAFSRALNSDGNVKELVDAGLRPATYPHHHQQPGSTPTRQGRSVSPRAGSATPRQRSASSSRAPSVQGRAAVMASTAPPAHEPQPDAPIPAMHGDAPMAAPRSARVPAPPKAMAQEQLRSQQPAAQHAATARGAPSASPSAMPAVGASPRRAAQEEALGEQLSAIRGIDASPHKKRTARKLAYRRSRNQAYEDAWELSRAERVRHAEEEAARDKEAAALIGQRQADDSARQRAELADRRAEERRVQEVNLELARKRRGNGVPRAQGPGDIFDARRNTGRVPADRATLERQIAERRDREAREKAEAAAYGEAAWYEQQELLAEEKRKKEEAKAERQAALREYADIAQQKRQLAKQAREEDELLEQKCTGFQGFGLGGDTFKAQSVQIQKANYEMVKARAVERERREQAERERLAEAVRRIEARDAALRDQELRSKRAKQSAMRTEWTNQSAQVKAAKQREREERKNWRDVNFLRNESSDDEDDDPSVADRVQFISKRRPVTAASTTSNAVYGAAAAASYTPRPPSSSPRAAAH